MGVEFKSEYFKVFTISVSLHFNRLVCEAFISAASVCVCMYLCAQMPLTKTDG